MAIHFRRLITLALALALAGALLAVQPAPPAYAATFTVTNTNDAGPGSLRAAIESANATSKKDIIKFKIPGIGRHVITLLSPLPDIVRPIVIDGASQPSFPGTLAIWLNGGGSVSAGLRLMAGSNGSTIKGLSIGGFGMVAIYLEGSNKHIIQGNYLGTQDIMTAPGNPFGLLLVNSDDNLIGGKTPSQGNLISGDYIYGIEMQSGSSGNVVQGNLIGTDETGALPSPNGSFGVRMLDASNNTIGGTASGAGNVISGNNNGVEVSGSAASGNLIQGNFIGTDASGTLDLGNNGIGVYISGAPNNTIGGTAPGARNVISGNNLYGIQINGGGASGNLVQGNFIGTDVFGTLDLGNTNYGVYMTGAPNNIIGGTAPGAHNVISGNDVDGIHINGSGATGNLVQGNFIGTDVSGTLDLGNSTVGVRVDAANNTIGGATPGAGNLIAYSNYGVAAFNVSGLNIQRNRIENNTFNGIQLSGSSTITTNTMNCIQGNTTGMTNTTIVPTTAENNWWGDLTGPTHATNPGGTGQSVSNDVDFDPWATSSCEAVVGDRVTNGGMEVDANTNLLPDGWVGKGLKLNPSNDGQDCATSHAGSCSFRFKGSGKLKTLTQTINIGGVAGEDITLSVYSREDSLPTGGKYRVTLTVFHNAGSKQTAVITLPLTTNAWASHTAPALVAAKAYKKLEVKVEFQKSTGSAWLDDVSVAVLP